jgi:hypothetical protein
MLTDDVPQRSTGLGHTAECPCRRQRQIQPLRFIFEDLANRATLHAIFLGDIFLSDIGIIVMILTYFPALGVRESTLRSISTDGGA